MGVTDHRPLLGINASLDLTGHDPMHTIWREQTEQHRSRETLVYVVGSRQLADCWTRLWPHETSPAENITASVVGVENGDFVPHEKDIFLLSEPSKGLEN